MDSRRIQSPPPPPSSDTNFPILAISILGILTVAILLLSYYIFVIKCRLNWHRSDVIGRLSRRIYRRHEDFIAVYSTASQSQGLEESAIQAIPTFRFRSGGGGQGKGSFHECAVCLNEFQEEERIRLLPICCHVFHIDCIDAWLQSNASCPLCRSDITTTNPIPNDYQFMVQTIQQNFHHSEDIVIEVRDEDSHWSPRSDGHCNTPIRKAEDQRFGHKKGRKFNHAGSMGDECIDVREKDEQFSVQPIRRSFSMDSSCDRQLYIAVQEILQQDNSSSSSSVSTRGKRPFFSFGNSRSSVLPI